VNSDGKELETNMQRKKERKKESWPFLSNSSTPSRHHPHGDTDPTMRQQQTGWMILAAATS
jgi:hypothetical protein